jgi:hypothetical protein
MRGALLAALLGLAGCVNEQTIAASLSNAAHPPRLPEVFACWEKEFEASGFQGEYVAVIDLRIDGASKIHDAKVKALEPAAGGSSRDPAAFRACLEAALDRSSLPAADDADGPGFHVPFGVELSNVRVAFTDSPARKRAAASGRQANVLVGPRADRCAGLYSHSPPRDAGTLYDEIAQADGRVREAAEDADRRARELQKKYDAELELIERLGADLAQPGLPEANKTRLKKALAEVTDAAKKTGARIGCKR